MYQDIILIILAFMLFLITIYGFIVMIKFCNNVIKNSDNLQELKHINSIYSFESFFRRKRKIYHRARTLHSLRKIQIFDIIGYHIENNIEHIRDDIEIAIRNNKKYSEYLEEVSVLRENINVKKANDKNIKNVIYCLLEKIFIRIKMIRNPYNIIVNLFAYYESPKGKNFYKKTSILDYENLFQNYKKWEKNKNYKISAKYERSIMSDSIRYDVLKRDNYKCCICGMSARDGAKLHVDHIIPVSKGGKTVISNLQTLCERCNLGKSNK